MKWNFSWFYNFSDFVDMYISRPLSVLFLVAFGILFLVSTINVFYGYVEGIRFPLEHIPIINKGIYKSIREKVESNAEKKDIIDTVINEVVVKNVIALIVLGILIALLK